MNGKFSRKVIDNYLLEEPIAERLNTTIYRAVDVSLKCFVMLKITPLPPNEAARDTYLQAFKEQLKRIVSLEHLNLQPVYSSGCIGNEAVYIASRLLPGRLDGLLRAGPLSLDAAVVITQQVASALIYLHAHGFVHSSLSPWAVYVTSENQVYLDDLEIAQLVQRAPSIEVLRQLLGTFHYAPPELLQQQPLDVRADVYSLGATLYDMVTGEVPFRNATSIEDLLHQKLSNALRPASTLSPQVTPTLEAVILRALCANPAERFQSVQAMRDALGSVSLAEPPIFEEHTGQFFRRIMASTWKLNG